MLALIIYSIVPTGMVRINRWRERCQEKLEICHVPKTRVLAWPLKEQLDKAEVDEQGEGVSCCLWEMHSARSSFSLACGCFLLRLSDDCNILKHKSMYLSCGHGLSSPWEITPTNPSSTHPGNRGLLKDESPWSWLMTAIFIPPKTPGPRITCSASGLKITYSLAVLPLAEVELKWRPFILVTSCPWTTMSLPWTFL